MNDGQTSLPMKQQEAKKRPNKRTILAHKYRNRKRSCNPQRRIRRITTVLRSAQMQLVVHMIGSPKP
jgi:hypothetical protein